MNPSATKQVRDWLEDDFGAFVHLRHCVEEKYGSEQIARFLKAMFNDMIEKNEWEVDAERVNWMELAQEVPLIFRRRALSVIRESGK